MRTEEDAIYLDHAATTPMRPEVRSAMEPFLSEAFGNPSSVHRWGRKAATALEDARTRIGDALDVDRNDVFFVRGGTESDNLAVLGRAECARSEGREPVLVVSAIEHKAVLAAAELATCNGGECIKLPVDPAGRIDDEALDAALAKKPDLVSTMIVNNEVGLRLPVAEVARRAKEAGAPVHTDAVQALGKVPVSFPELGIDLATLTGHKIYGPKSTGMLYRRRGVELECRVVGGGQERGVRPGTQDVPGAVGLATAIELTVREQSTESQRLARLKEILLGKLQAGIDGLTIHGEPAACAPHVLNVGIPGVDRQALMIELDIAGVAASAGSACQSGSTTGSHVLKALYGDTLTGPSLRFSLGKLNDEANVAAAAGRVVEVVARIRSYALSA